MSASSSTIHITVITGASAGLGRAMAEGLLRRPGQQLLCISRRHSAELAATARSHGANLEQWTHDLSDAASLCERLSTWLSSFDPQSVRSVTLINNAALMARPGPISDADPGDLAISLRVGLEAPMLLTSVLLNATKAWSCLRKVLNISSGLGRSAMAGQAPYCAAKAGLDHFSRAVALEEAGRPNGAKIASLAPGVVDTGMQQLLRSAPRDQFPEAAKFDKFKAENVLDAPDVAAAKVLAWLERDDFGQDAVCDVRNA